MSAGDSLKVSVPTLVVSTVGTSTFTHGAPDNLRRALARAANAHSADDLAVAERRLVEEHLHQREAESREWGPVAARKHSAELNGLLAMANGQVEELRSWQHVLVTSDTWMGRRAVHLVADWLRRNGATRVEPYPAEDVQAVDSARLHMGLGRLANALVERIQPRDKTVFHLTGGFKSANGFLQALGMLYANEVVYLFEAGEHVVRIPRLPVDVDLSTLGTPEILSPLRRLATGLSVPVRAHAHVIAKLGVMVDVIEDEAVLSAWGAVIWPRVRERTYGVGLLPPWHPKLKFGEAMAKSVEGLTADQIHAVNERVDDLCRYVENGQRLQRLDLKMIKGGAIGGATHEADAWANGAAKRLYLVKDDDVWTLLRLDAALH